MKKIAFTFLAICLVSYLGLAQSTTQPALDRAALEIRANEDFNRGQYATAMPLLLKLADMSKGQADVLAPIQEKIRVCVANLGANALNGPRPADGSAPALASLSANRTPHVKPKPGEIAEMDIKELGNFDYDAEKGGNIPADVVALTGSKIRLKGYMIPMDQAANITQFALVPSLFSCCFGQPPQIQHTIIANCPKGKAVGYFPDEITIEGTLKVQEKKDEGFIVSIFEVEVSSVKPSPQ